MQTKKYLLLLLAVVVIGLVVVMCNSRVEHSDGSQPTPAVQGVDTVPLLITQVQKCAKLYTAEYHVHKIVCDPRRCAAPEGHGAETWLRYQDALR